MYQSIKSCVRQNGQVTNFFPCNIGLRRENLSPILFSLFLNELEQFLEDNNCEGINIEYFSEEFYTYTKILVILYADDTVIIAEGENKLQASLDNFLSYCKKWKLQINYKKTKILIFGARNIEKFKFYLDGNLIEIVDNFKYLGVYF